MTIVCVLVAIKLNTTVNDKMDVRKNISELTLCVFMKFITTLFVRDALGCLMGNNIYAHIDNINKILKYLSTFWQILFR